jgi:hypothetical protein
VYNTLGGWLRDDRLAALVLWEWMEDRLRVAKGWQMWTAPAGAIHALALVWLLRIAYVGVGRKGVSEAV